MITFLEAEMKVIDILANKSIASGKNLVLDKEISGDELFGWVFYYNSKEFLETNERRYMLLGNGPFIVNKFTGEVVQLGSFDFERQLEEYRRKWKGYPNGPSL